MAGKIVISKSPSGFCLPEHVMEHMYLAGCPNVAKRIVHYVGVSKYVEHPAGFFDEHRCDPYLINAVEAVCKGRNSPLTAVDAPTGEFILFHTPHRPPEIRSCGKNRVLLVGVEYVRIRNNTGHSIKYRGR